MKLIPVIDLMHRQVVGAVAGARSSYRPSATPLCASSQPAAVLSALLSVYPFDSVYIADLDAIGGTGSNLEAIEKLRSDNPGIVFWVDNGLTELDRLCRFACPVIGTESLLDQRQLARLLEQLPDPILSLDYQGDAFAGPSGLDHCPRLWPERVIVMTLSRVGAAAGPDLQRLAQLKKRSPGHRFFAAGGVRHSGDLERLDTAGVSGVLLSTALHRGTLDGDALRYYAS